MRAIFSIVSLLIVVAIVGMLAKKQLGPVSATARPAQEGAIALPATSPGATPQAQSLQIQQQVKQQVETSLQQARPMPPDEP